MITLFLVTVEGSISSEKTIYGFLSIVTFVALLAGKTFEIVGAVLSLVEK